MTDLMPLICRPCGRRQHYPDVVCNPELCPGWRDPDPRYPIALAYGVCQQARCTSAWQTYCPLCQRLLCKAHDELVPRRMHDCLVGPADEAA